MNKNVPDARRLSPSSHETSPSSAVSVHRMLVWKQVSPLYSRQKNLLLQQLSKAVSDRARGGCKKGRSVITLVSELTH